MLTLSKTIKVFSKSAPCWPKGLTIFSQRFLCPNFGTSEDRPKGNLAHILETHQRSSKKKITNIKELKESFKIKEKGASKSGIDSGSEIDYSLQRPIDDFTIKSNKESKPRIPNAEYFEIKDKQLSSEILRCLKRDEIINLFEKKFSKK